MTCQHKAARLIFNGESFLSPRMDEADSAAVEKEAVSAEILGKRRGSAALCRKSHLR